MEVKRSRSSSRNEPGRLSESMRLKCVLNKFRTESVSRGEIELLLICSKQAVLEVQ